MMKVALLTLLFVGAAFGAAIEQGAFAEGPRCPIADPLNVDAGAINVTVTKAIFELFEGSRQEGCVAEGLGDGLYYTYEINTLTLSFTFSATITAKIAGDKYNAEGTVDAHPFTAAVVPSGPLSGSGPFSGSIVGGKIDANGKIFIDVFSNKVSVYDLEITTIGFDQLTADAGVLVIGGVTIDFAAWSASIKASFDAEWTLYGVEFTKRVQAEVINPFVGQYTLAELLEMIGQTGTQAPCPTTPTPTF